MDDVGHHENGRHKPPRGQWLMQHQPSMKQIMGIMAERDSAIQERNLALSEKKAALAERDLAILQRDSSMAERNNAIMERDKAIATLQYRENAMNGGTISPCPTRCQMTSGGWVKHTHQPQQHVHHQPHMAEAAYGTRDMHIPMLSAPSEPAKARQTKRTKDAKAETPTKRLPKSLKKAKMEAEDLNKSFGKSQEWNRNQLVGENADDLNKQLVLVKPDWKDQDLSLNQVAFDGSTMPVPVCSCTGVVRQCYKWGNGGFQSSCCTTNLSMFPLPAVINKRHARIGGRKMSGSAFNKLLSRLAGEGHDLSNPVDLKEHWAKHGTNRYITIK